MVSNFIQSAVEYFDHVLDQGTDDQVFASSYVRGHLDVAAAGCQPHDWQSMVAETERSLEAAFKAGELNPDDQALVNTMWQALIAHCTNCESTSPASISC